MSEEVFKVEKICRKKFDEKRKEWLYLIKWYGYDTDESTWEPEENLCYIPEVVAKFNKKWDLRELLVKKKKEEKLKTLVNTKKTRLTKSKNEPLFNNNELIDLALDRVDIQDEEQEKETKTDDENKESTVNFFESLSVVPGKMFFNEIGKILGLREYKGKVYVGVMYKSRDFKPATLGSIDLQSFASSYSHLLRPFLLKKLSNH
jgi:Chromo (CHRromatin Organisation MOdifier) domain